jgi:hypothetical protein
MGAYDWNCEICSNDMCFAKEYGAPDCRGFEFELKPKKREKKPMIKKYRKKPVVIEALNVEVGYRNLNEIIEFVGKDNLCPIERRPNYILKVKTLEGNMAVHYGDYIIKGIKGEFYPCKPDIFETTYEEVTEDKKAFTKIPSYNDPDNY